jgi:hypothetical protein
MAPAIGDRFIMNAYPFLSLLFLFAAPPASQPSSAPSLSTEDQTRLAEQVDSLVRSLADANYQTREASQQKLQGLGDAALPLLVRHLASSNPEISSRVESIIRTPKDPRLCAELAFKLIATTDPDWMEKGVHMLYESPVEVSEHFAELAGKSQGIVRRVCEPVVSQLQETNRRWQHFLKRHRKLLEADPGQAAREFTMQTESNLYEAEAAYWMAHDVLLDEQEGTVTEGKPVKSAASEPAEK